MVSLVSIIKITVDENRHLNNIFHRPLWSKLQLDLMTVAKHTFTSNPVWFRLTTDCYACMHACIFPVFRFRTSYKHLEVYTNLKNFAICRNCQVSDCLIYEYILERQFAHELKWNTPWPSKTKCMLPRIMVTAI